MPTTASLQYVRVPAIVQDEKAMLIDRNGRSLHAAIPLDRITSAVPDEVVEDLIWKAAVHRLVNRL